MESFREQVLIINYLSLPIAIKKEIENRDRFGNDIMLEHISELTYRTQEEKKAGKDLSDNITTSVIEDYYRDQCTNNNYKGSIEDFIVAYGLKVDAWLIQEGVDLKGIQRILFDICW